MRPPGATMTNRFDRNSRLLTESAWLSVLPEALRGRVLDECKPRECRKGEALWHFADPVDGLYCILSGSLRSETEQVSHGPSMLTIFHAGSWIGEAEILAGTPRITTMTSLRDCAFAFLPQARLLALLKDYPELWRGLGYLAAEHLYISVAGLYDLMIRSSSDRLAAILLRICGARVREFPGPTNTSLDVTQSELGQMCNLSRSVISTLLDQFAEKGLIESHYGRIDILDIESLAKMVGVTFTEQKPG
jgi:CRP-like cAMP-binding protein